MLGLQRTQLQLPTPIMDGSLLPVNPVLEDWSPLVSTGICTISTLVVIVIVIINSSSNDDDNKSFLLKPLYYIM